MSGKITVIDRQQNEKRSRRYGSPWTQTTIKTRIFARQRWNFSRIFHRTDRTFEPFNNVSN